MNQPKLTPEFPANVKPVHVGVYLTRITKVSSQGEYPYCYWNGHFWSIGDCSPDRALDYFRTKSAYQSRPWRGLAEEPK